jgi:hypothetical protein
VADNTNSTRIFCGEQVIYAILAIFCGKSAWIGSGDQRGKRIETSERTENKSPGFSLAEGLFH